MPRATIATIDRSSLAQNCRALKSRLAPACRMMAVVKDDAYGHGSVETARVALKNGVDWLAVGMAEEGVTLRENGIAAPILILAASPLSSVDAILRWDLRCGLSEEALLLALQKAAQQKRARVKVHLKLDSGMHRLGAMDEGELRKLLETWKRCPNVVLEGVYTHFASADSADKSYLKEQKRRFDALLAVIKACGHDKPIVHASNTAATLDASDCHYDMVRCGIGLYGYYPSGDVRRDVALSPVMSWTTEISRVFWLRRGETTSYGQDYTAPNDRLIATLPVGYGDGYRRILGGRASVLINGQRAPVVGRVCMDLMMADITDIDDEIEVGDPVVLLGAQGNERIDADEMARWADTISYEILVGVSKRVPRDYR